MVVDIEKVLIAVAGDAVLQSVLAKCMKLTNGGSDLPVIKV